MSMARNQCKSIALEETTIIEVTNDSDEEINTFRIWLGTVILVSNLLKLKKDGQVKKHHKELSFLHHLSQSKKVNQ